ncbi:hypothetical protein RND71_030248 [Anisodus tanguticus]|uniref:Uncharacterized protein n=1 Tax=Anisodus tanguticus TaxID=243964 RepID=A0AAE1V805_9SOLA|nr:hypothetical protein RND71_030248 [Anisodus tanguticus]
MKVSKPVFSLQSRHKITQEEFINGITDVDGVDGDKKRQSALLRLALDDVGSQVGVAVERGTARSRVRSPA